MSTQCDYYNAGTCRSCTLLPQPYAAQLAQKLARARAVLASVAADARWLPPEPSAPMGFRNKAKLAIGGRPGATTLGILDPGGAGVDLRACGLYEPGLAELLPLLADFVDELEMVPYHLPSRRGELKYLLVTHSPDGEVMVRLVLRSRSEVDRIRKHLARLLESAPNIVVVSANIHPEHKAVLEGDLEIVLTERESLAMRVNDITLHLRPRSFFQTNTAVAAALYRRAREWITDADPATVWDLYCGVGGFALHALDPPPTRRRVTGVEVSTDAVASAERSAQEAGVSSSARFLAGDAVQFARRSRPPDLVIVNPPRRGIGAELASWLEGSAVREVLYSSCHVDSLAADLASMPSMVVEKVQLFDMFPNTTHHETLISLTRR